MIPPPDPEDIPTIDFNHPAAENLVRELTLTVQAMLGAMGVMEGDLPEVTADWRGLFRHTFDYESARHDLAARSLAQTLYLTAVAVQAKEYEVRAANRKLRRDFLDDWYAR
jgi:hypothetical protein